MSLPSTNANGQPSIRNFFKPKPPSYAPPPTAVSRTPAAAAAAAAATAPPAPSPPPPPPPAAGQNGLKTPLSTTATTSVPVPVPAPAPAPAPAPSSRPASLHPQATISPILPEHIPALRRITSLLLPVNYPDTFYQRLSDPQSSGAFSRVLLWTDDGASSSSTTTTTTTSSSSSSSNAAPPKVVGGLVCRPEPSPFAPSSRPTRKPQAGDDVKPNALYVQSLVLLAPYRQNGLAAALLDEVTRLAAASPFACDEVYAHVWTDNEDAMRWYLARGFAKHGQVNGYYFKLRPDSAYIVRRPIVHNSSSSSPVVSSGLLGQKNSTVAGASAGAGAIPPSATAAAANLLMSQRTPPVSTPPVLAATSTSTPGPLSAPPPLGPPRSGSGGPSPNRSPGPGMSFQNARPQTEWNDLPADMHSGGTATPNSNASSRSSSAAPRKKRDRAYPAAAFGK
ncbi:hypothetical protein Hte_008648 [Hypoxylon texense]